MLFMISVLLYFGKDNILINFVTIVFWQNNYNLTLKIIKICFLLLIIFCLIYSEQKIGLQCFTTTRPLSKNTKFSGFLANF